MQTLQYCVETRARLSQLKSKNISIKAKICLLESLRQNLKDIHAFQCAHQNEKHKLDLSSTFFTETRSLISVEEEETLIEQILKKQKVKIELDQEIETADDDLVEVSKVIQTKQQCSEELSAKIAEKTKEIDEQKIREEKKQSKLTKVKSTPSLFQKIFG